METQITAPSSSFGFISKTTKYRYDVFLSFRGEDTRHSFTAPLYEALRRKGINAFIDDKKLGKGEKISPTLLRAIERSRISIIVFSENYATSTWCLEELAHIIWCRKQKNQLVMPVFYKVDPMDVQYQRNSFGDAMANLEDRFRGDLNKVQKWRFALSEAASLSLAWLFEDGFEFGFIEKIVEDAYAMLPLKRLHRPIYMVGLEPRVEEVISLLNQYEDRVFTLGIYGTGGIGKTTLAKAVYNSIFYQFEGSCFLFDVQESSSKYQGIVRLQQKLLSKILEEKIMMFGSVDEGISRIKHRLSHKKVLLVLDDVDEVEQLEKLAGGCDWFGRGSKIIITTRNKQLLIACKVERTYEMKNLNKHDSLALFCWHAFHMSQPPKEYQDMSSCVISYAGGLPLALRVIGSNLADKSLEEWKSILEQYERIPERTIYDVLKISYDCLQDGAKRIFLDIACFNKEVFQSIKETEAFDFSVRFYLEVLIDKSLITVYEGGLNIHSLVRQMGREIVRQEAPSNPEMRSRLWDYKDILKVLCQNQECNNNIEGIILDPPQQEKLEWSGMAFEKMNNLRILIVRNVQFSTGPKYLPNSLRWLEWYGYPSTTLPKDFSPSELVFLKLPASSIILTEQPIKSFANHVTHMNFSYCEFITEIPDMSQLQCLRTLKFSYSGNLIKVHDSVGHLSKLKELDFSGCSKLSIFPYEINMPTLQWLHLESCKSLEYFPNVVGNMDALELISITQTAIKELPPSIGNLSRLRTLAMNFCRNLSKLPTSLCTLPIENIGMSDVHPHAAKYLTKSMQHVQPIRSNRMKNLYLINCGLLDEGLLLILSCFPNLRELYLSGNDFVSVPKCIKESANLTILDINNCKRLRNIPSELPSKLHQIIAQDCQSLSGESMDNLYSQVKKELYDLYITMPTIKTFPDWLDYCCEGGTFSFCARRDFLPHAVFAAEFGSATSMRHSFRVFMRNNGHKIEVDIPFSAGNYIDELPNHVLLFHLPITIVKQELIDSFMGLDWNDLELQVISDSPDVDIVKCGVYVYKKQANIMENVQFKRKRRATASPSKSNEPPKKRS